MLDAVDCVASSLEGIVAWGACYVLLSLWTCGLVVLRYSVLTLLLLGSYSVLYAPYVRYMHL